MFKNIFGKRPAKPSSDSDTPDESDSQSSHDDGAESARPPKAQAGKAEKEQKVVRPKEKAKPKGKSAPVQHGNVIEAYDDLKRRRQSIPATLSTQVGDMYRDLGNAPKAAELYMEAAAQLVADEAWSAALILVKKSERALGRMTIPLQFMLIQVALGQGEWLDAASAVHQAGERLTPSEGVQIERLIEVVDRDPTTDPSVEIALAEVLTTLGRSDRAAERLRIALTRAERGRRGALVAEIKERLSQTANVSARPQEPRWQIPAPAQMEVRPVTEPSEADRAPGTGFGIPDPAPTPPARSPFDPPTPAPAIPRDVPSDGVTFVMPPKTPTPTPTPLPGLPTFTPSPTPPAPPAPGLPGLPTFAPPAPTPVPGLPTFAPPAPTPVPVPGLPALPALVPQPTPQAPSTPAAVPPAPPVIPPLPGLAPVRIPGLPSLPTATPAPSPAPAPAPVPAPAPAQAPAPAPTTAPEPVQPPAAASSAQAPASQDVWVDPASLRRPATDVPQSGSTRFVGTDGRALSDSEADQMRHLTQQLRDGLKAQVPASDAETHYELGFSFLSMAMYTEAIDAFQKAFRAPDFRMQAAEGLAQAFIGQGDAFLARRALRLVLDEQPAGTDDADQLGLLYWSGRAAEEMNSRTEAIEFYERVSLVDAEFDDSLPRLRHLYAQPY